MSKKASSARIFGGTLLSGMIWLGGGAGEASAAHATIGVHASSTSPTPVAHVVPARQVLEEWLAQRAVLARDDERALWVSRTGGRLSARSADRDVRAVGAAAGLALSAHTLRHTCLTGLLRRGNDLVMVAELAGHQKLETTRRYTLPSQADRQRAVEDLQIDY